jgi:hypothetical protein
MQGLKEESFAASLSVAGKRKAVADVKDRSVVAVYFSGRAAA